MHLLHIYQFVCVGFILTSYDLLIHLQARNKYSPTGREGEKNGKKINNGIEFLTGVEKELNPPWNKSVLPTNQCDVKFS
jgi:hypothetical protein